tara:strand:+ start:517 stop:633 length:117 start_codon:yes stop_codon:yes gene_type:complete
MPCRKSNNIFPTLHSLTLGKIIELKIYGKDLEKADENL